MCCFRCCMCATGSSAVQCCCVALLCRMFCGVSYRVETFFCRGSATRCRASAVWCRTPLPGNSQDVYFGVAIQKLVLFICGALFIELHAHTLNSFLPSPTVSTPSFLPPQRQHCPPSDPKLTFPYPLHLLATVQVVRILEQLFQRFCQRSAHRPQHQASAIFGTISVVKTTMKGEMMGNAPL